MANSTSCTEKSEPDMKRKRKHKYPPTTEPKVEYIDDFFDDEFLDLKEEEEYEALSLHPTNAAGLKLKGKTHHGSESSDGVSSKKEKFTVRKFPRRKVCAVVQPSSNPHQDEHGEDLPTKLAKLKTAIENLSGDWDVIMRAPEIATIDALHENSAERDDHIFKSKKGNAAADILHKESEKMPISWD
ncbi:hypothetical protein DSL72_002034 [Monilinia vaccinii-corymbosi]|uniref:Uncharacterized protein n=1 Tax=Monilinia vaccinii-corymbosi TaxID=61207 RepID=A0A8A3PBG8_9HELO|nr:hypothetical protein DSL72_002034 [Monilinia vaccinii-corymbosi]